MNETVNSDFLEATIYPYDLQAMRESLINKDRLVTAFSWLKTPQEEEYWSEIHTHGHTETSRKILTKMITLADAAEKHPIGSTVTRTNHNPSFGSDVWKEGKSYEITAMFHQSNGVCFSVDNVGAVEEKIFADYFTPAKEITEEAHIVRKENFSELTQSLGESFMLTSAFTWSETPQGQEYWNGIHTNGHTETSKRIIQKMITAYEGTQMDEITEEVDITKLNRSQLGTLKEALLDSGYVASAFDWESTPQGHVYWSDINNTGHTDTSKRIIQKMINQQEAEMAGSEVTEDISVVDLEDLDDLKRGLENHDVIHEAFCWCATPQKHDYWNNIHETGHTDKSKRIVRKMITELEKTLPNQAKVVEQIVTKRQGIKKWLLG